MALRFRPFERSDLPVLSGWLTMPHVKAFWIELLSPEEQYGPAIDGSDPTELFLVERGVASDSPAGPAGEPVAFVQRYLMRDYPQWVQALTGTGVPDPENAAGIDYLIGVPELIGRGLGPTIIDQFVEDIWRRYPGIGAVATSVSEGNRRSWRALEKAGFRRTYTGEIESDDPSDQGVSVVYVRPRPGRDDVAGRFRSLHYGPGPLLLPNPWDGGSAKVLASLGFEALATTSSGCAATLGRLDGSVSRDEALAHAASIVAATTLPVSADLENGFADDPEGVADTVRLASSTGLAGMSVEDYSTDPESPIYPVELAAERVAAAATVAHSAPSRPVLTARAENYLHGRPDLADTIERLQRYQQAGADVLYAPGLSSLDDIRAVVAAVERPVNVIARPGAPTVAELAAVGVKRISVGGAFAFASLGALVEAARELMEHGTYSYTERSRLGLEQARSAFGN